MDHVDVKIIKLLQKNARSTASDIGIEVNLSVPSVRGRLKKLEASGAIQQYTAIVNSRLVNRNLTVLMFVTLENPKYSDEFVGFVNQMNEIIECHSLAGDYDYMLKIITENTTSLETLFNRIKSQHGVRKTKTTVVLSSAKNNYSVAVDE